MRTIFQYALAGLLLLALHQHSAAAADSFGRAVLRELGTNSFPGRMIEVSSLLDATNTAPKLSPSKLDGIKARPQVEIAGAHLGLSIDQLVERWGKPRSIWVYCDGGLALAYGGSMYGDIRVVVAPATCAITNVLLTLPKSRQGAARPRVGECLSLFGEPTLRQISPDPFNPSQVPGASSPDRYDCRMVYESATATTTLWFVGGELYSLEVGRCSNRATPQSR
jgi:hypothetical protein